MSDYVDFSALGQGLFWSVIGGAGLVAVFSLGLVGLSRHDGGLTTGEHSHGAADVQKDSMGLVLAVACFAVVLLGAAAGIWTMIQK